MSSCLHVHVAGPRGPWRGTVCKRSSGFLTPPPSTGPAHALRRPGPALSRALQLLLPLPRPLGTCLLAICSQLEVILSRV